MAVIYINDRVSRAIEKLQDKKFRETNVKLSASDALESLLVETGFIIYESELNNEERQILNAKPIKD